MTDRSVLAFRGSAIAFFGAGVVFLANDNPGLGLGLFLVGLAFMVRSTKGGSSLAQERPVFFALILAGLIVLTLVIAAVLLLPKYF